MSSNKGFGRILPAVFALLVSAGFMLHALLRLSAGRDAIGLYWVVVSLLVLYGVRSRSNSVYRE